MNRVSCKLSRRPAIANESHEVPRQQYATCKARALIFESSRTLKLVVRYKMVYWPHGLSMSVKTCTQPRSEVAIISVCCGESPTSKSGYRCCLFGSCHLQTVHTPDHYDLRPRRRSVRHLQTAQSVDNSQTHKRTELQSTYIGLCLPSAVLQLDPATLRGSDSYLEVGTLLRRGVHDHAALEDTCTQRCRQRGTDFRACTLREARCHPTHGIMLTGRCSIAGAEICQYTPLIPAV